MISPFIRLALLTANQELVALYPDNVLEFLKHAVTGADQSLNHKASKNLTAD